MPLKGIVTKDLTPKEYDWLDMVIPKGTVVYLYSESTYGAVSADGIAVTLKPNKSPFFEVPSDLVEWEE